MRAAKSPLNRDRFEVTIGYGGRTVKHICVATDQAEATDKMLRPYARYDPMVKKVVNLGKLPKIRKTGMATAPIKVVRHDHS